MNKNLKPRNVCLHLYNPKQEGIGEYDSHYINAYRKNKIIVETLAKDEMGRFAA